MMSTVRQLMLSVVGFFGCTRATSPPSRGPVNANVRHRFVEPGQPDAIALMTASKPPVSNPIDAFILKVLAEQKLTPSKPAEPRVLIRRLYYDHIGLPPTPHAM